MPPYNIGRFWKGRKQPESVRKKNSESLRQAYREGRHKKVWLKRKFTRGHKERIRKSNRKAWQGITLRIEQIKQARKRWKSKDARKKHAEIMKKRYEDRVLRAKMAIILRQAKLKPAARKKAREITIQHPYLKKDFKKRLEVYLATYELKMLLGKDKEKPTIRTLTRYKVRSSYEKDAVNFLWFEKIKQEYETICLFFPEMFCIPDIYLREFNIIIEIAGQFPKTRAKNTIKRKVYKKYNIPVVWLTPSSFADLHRSIILRITDRNMRKKSKKFSLKYWTNPLNYKRIKALKEKKPDIYNKYAKELKKEFPRTKSG
jgi:hypothetical protein